MAPAQGFFYLLYLLNKYWILAAGFGMLAILIPILLFSVPKGRKLKTTTIVSILLFIPFYIGYRINLGGIEERQSAFHKEEAERDRKRESAQKIFDQRCKEEDKEVIYKTVDNVDGITLLKLRGDFNPEPDQYWVDAAAYEDTYSPQSRFVTSFFYITRRLDKTITYPNGKVKSERVSERLPHYQYVDVLQENGNYNRFMAKPYLELVAVARTENYTKTGDRLKGQPSRYTVDFINDIHPEDREHWIASTKIIIKDSQTKELLAEKTWFLFDPAMGYHGQAATSNWKYWGRFCTNRKRNELYLNKQPTMRFVSQVLKPSGIMEIKGL